MYVVYAREVLPTPCARGIIGGKHKKKNASNVLRATRREALFKDPPAKEDCPICFMPMPIRVINCVSPPDATIESVPVHDSANANVQLAKESIIHVAGNAFVEGAYTPSMSLVTPLLSQETWDSVPFAIPT